MNSNHHHHQQQPDTLPLALAAKYVQDTESYNASDSSAGGAHGGNYRPGSYQNQANYLNYGPGTGDSKESYDNNDYDINGSRPLIDNDEDHNRGITVPNSYNNNNGSSNNNNNSDGGGRIDYLNQSLLDEKRRPSPTGASYSGHNNNGNNNGAGSNISNSGQQSYEFETKIPVGAVLFVFGFLFMPLWWIGTVFPRNSRRDVDLVWRKYNSLMAFASILLLGLIIALAAWHAAHN
ncbi:hypothetical protein H4219_002297 [Mycoemilia scoparia]|uniref:Uncharacterized protein n=1 Tax=Mycoemilia scoparia TaxID=417184 RepID=A0A9W7ZYQ0_9FUNG|nr:hypothetical protein H4219_002297 [Mycoemilia scoparia]